MDPIVQNQKLSTSSHTIDTPQQTIQNTNQQDNGVTQQDQPSAPKFSKKRISIILISVLMILILGIGIIMYLYLNISRDEFIENTDQVFAPDTGKQQPTKVAQATGAEFQTESNKYFSISFPSKYYYKDLIQEDLNFGCAYILNTEEIQDASQYIHVCYFTESFNKLHPDVPKNGKYQKMTINDRTAYKYIGVPEAVRDSNYYVLSSQDGFISLLSIMPEEVLDEAVKSVSFN